MGGHRACWPDTWLCPCPGQPPPRPRPPPAAGSWLSLPAWTFLVIGFSPSPRGGKPLPGAGSRRTNQVSTGMAPRFCLGCREGGSSRRTCWLGVWRMDRSSWSPERREGMFGGGGGLALSPPGGAELHSCEVGPEAWRLQALPGQAQENRTGPRPLRARATDIGSDRALAPGAHGSGWQELLSCRRAGPRAGVGTSWGQGLDLRAWGTSGAAWASWAQQGSQG